MSTVSPFMLFQTWQFVGWLSHDVNSLKASKYITNTSKSKYSPYLIGCKNAYIEMRLFAIEIDKSKN